MAGVPLGRIYAGQSGTAGGGAAGVKHVATGLTQGRLRPPHLASRWLAHPVVKAVGGLVELRAMDLIGAGNRGRKVFGSCMWEGNVCTFDFWFPHLGLAVDVREYDHAPDCDPKAESNKCATCLEQAAKRQWCSEQCILYVPPGLPVSELAILATKRREVMTS